MRGETKILSETPFLELVEEEYGTPDPESGTYLKWDYVRRRKSKGVVTIIARDSHSKRYLFVVQDRVPVHARVLEFPAGLYQPGEGHKSIRDAALAELEEETGYRNPKIVSVSDDLFTKSAGLTDEATAFVEMVVDARKVNRTRLERSEAERGLKHVWMSYNNLRNLVSGNLVDKRISNLKDVRVSSQVMAYFAGYSRRLSMYGRRRHRKR